MEWSLFPIPPDLWPQEGFGLVVAAARVSETETSLDTFDSGTLSALPNLTVWTPPCVHGELTFHSVHDPGSNPGGGNRFSRSFVRFFL